MAMHTGEIANLANIDLKNLGAPPTKRDRILREFLRKPIHPLRSTATAAIAALVCSARTLMDPDKDLFGARRQQVLLYLSPALRVSSENIG